MTGNTSCFACEMAVVDDLHRDEDGVLWHRACYDDHVHQVEMAPLDYAREQDRDQEAAIDRELRRRPGRASSRGGDFDE